MEGAGAGAGDVVVDLVDAVLQPFNFRWKALLNYRSGCKLSKRY
jgi:hypothetical protein